MCLLCYFTPIAEQFRGRKEVVPHSSVHSLKNLFRCYSEIAVGATCFLHAGKSVVHLACSAASGVVNHTFYSAALPWDGLE